MLKNDMKPKIIQESLKWEVATLPPAKNREELKTRILQGWANLGKRRDILRNLCDSMPRHVAALLETE